MRCLASLSFATLYVSGRLNEPPVADARHAEGKQGFPPPAGHSNHHFAWELPISFRTPPGYSILVTHPLNRFDLPFTTTSGLMDSDRWVTGGNIPFFFKNNIDSTNCYKILLGDKL